jgi:hypothetical protein
VRNIIAKYGIINADIYNFNETGFIMDQIIALMVVTSFNKKGKPKLAQPGNRKWATVIQGVNSQSWTIPPYIIIKGKYYFSFWYENDALPTNSRIAVSANG